MESALRTTLQNQKGVIRTINGAPPWVALGCVASFPPPGHELRVDAFDPEEKSSEAVDLEISEDRFMLAYYAPFVAALEYGEPAGNSDDLFEVVNLPAARARVGLLRSIADAVRQGQFSGAGLSSAVTVALAESPNLPFRDGSLVESDWNSELSLRNETRLS
jgi:hypothetical protein